MVTNSTNNLFFLLCLFGHFCLYRRDNDSVKGWRIEKRRPAANGDAAQTQTATRQTGLAGN